MNNSNLENVKTRKPFGLGSLSLLLCIMGLLFSVPAGNYDSFGDHILRFIGLNPWSNGDTGTHYTVIYSLIFFVPSLIIGHKITNDFGAKFGRYLSIIMIIAGFALLIFMVL